MLLIDQVTVSALFWGMRLLAGLQVLQSRLRFQHKLLQLRAGCAQLCGAVGGQQPKHLPVKCVAALCWSMLTIVLIISVFVQ